LVTDVCLKRKVRNYLAEVKPEAPEYKIYVRDKAVLNEQHELAYTAKGLKPEPKKLPKDEAKARVRKLLRHPRLRRCDDHGSQQRPGTWPHPAHLLAQSRSGRLGRVRHHPLRCDQQKDAESERTIGRKFTVPYGLYRCHGFLNASLAGATGFSEDDLELFKEALNNMFETDRSAARGLMSPVRCFAFRREKKTGNARADQLFAMVKAELKPELAAESKPPRSHRDYTIALEGNLPDGVTVEEWVTGSH
jgi:CRISPR-associated protein Csd2